MIRLVLIPGLVLALAAAACGGDNSLAQPTRPRPGADAATGSVTVIAPFARAVNDNTAAVYFTVKNTGGADRLLSATSPWAARAELHETVTDGQVTKMVRVLSLDVPAGGELALAPGNKHVMLTGLNRPLTQGALLELNLNFEIAGRVTVAAAIQRQGAETPTPTPTPTPSPTPTPTPTVTPTPGPGTPTAVPAITPGAVTPSTGTTPAAR